MPELADAGFRAGVRATVRPKLIACALWTEICVAFAALDARREGYDVHPVVDPIGGTSLRLIARASSASFRPAARPSAGCISRLNSRATGRAMRPRPASSTSC